MTLPSYVGRYEVRDEIATGGFAVVVEAWDEELESPVAIKILRRDLAADEDVLLRFLEEARLLRRIRSPHVVTVHDVGRLNDGRPYFVMDFADRGTLDSRLKRPAGAAGPDPQDLLVLVDAVADGLSALHEAGVVHRDVKPANILFQRARRGRTERSRDNQDTADGGPALVAGDERILLGDLGIAKDLVKHGSFATVIGGTPLYQAPEQDDAAERVTPAADVYAATALLWHVLTGERPPKPSQLTSALPGLPVAWQEVVEQGMALDPEARFGSMESWRSTIHETLAHEAAQIEGGRPTAAVPVHAPCPYKGLAAYQPEDAQFFFGREALVDELVRRVQLHQVLVVGGASGSGKSSLVRAGLIPALKAGALPGSESWQVTLFTPGRDPFAELFFHIRKGSEDTGSAVSLEDLVAHPTLARHLGGTDASRQPLVLCIDQFEELFTLVNEPQRSKFVAALSSMTDPADSRVRVVIVVRADFYAACAQIPWLAERITHNQVLVGPMTGPELRRAISEPARRAGLYLERGLVDAIVDEAGNEAGSLPLVAHALVETWGRRQGNTLSLEGFRAAGGVAGAISQTADATYEHRFDMSERDATKRLFLRLVTPGEGTSDTRRILARSEIEHDSNPQIMHRVVESLTEVRLLTVDDESVQIAHEALLRTWPRLRVWIEESRDDLRMRQRISRAASEWDAEARDSDLLYRGTPLLSALEWAGKNPDQLGELERAFLDASDETRRRAEAIALERQRRTRRVRRAGIALLSFLALGATTASVIAFLAFRDAQQNEERAAQATAEAHERFAGALGAAAHGLVKTDPLLALFLGGEAVARAETEPPGYDARAAMIAARRSLADQSPVLIGSPIPAGDALAIAMSPDGSMLASAHRDGSIDLIDTITRRRVGSSLRGHDGGVRDLVFASDGRLLVSAGADGTLRVWAIEDGLSDKGTKLGQVGDVISGVAFSPHGPIVASGNGDGTVQLWDAAKKTAVGKPLIDRDLGFKVVAFSPDGKSLIGGYNDGTIYGWSLASGEQLFEPIRGVHTSNLVKLVFSPRGDRFATASTDGTSIVFEYPSARVLGPAFADVGQIGAVVFTADAGVLVGGDAQGALNFWDPYAQRLLHTTPRGHSQAVTDIEVSEDGRLLATLGHDQAIRLWSFASSYPLNISFEVEGRAVKSVAFNRTHMAAGDDSGAVHLWSLDGEGEALQLAGHAHQVWGLAFAPGETRLASGDRTGEVRMWNAATGENEWAVEAHDGAVWSLLFTPDGKRLLSVSDMQMRLWNAKTGASEESFEYSGEPITRAAISPDGALLATSSSDGKVTLWDLTTLKRVKDFVADDNLVWSVRFSPDSKYLATASSDEVVAVWDIGSEERMATFAGHTGGATDVAYLSEGATIVAVDRTGRLHWWDVRTGRRLAEAWQAHDGVIWRIAIHPDREQLATAGADGRVKIWDELDVARACEIGKPGFDTVRRRQYLGENQYSVACDRGR